MYAPDQQRAADELTRVCRPGASAGAAAGRPAPAGPNLWGSEAHCRALFGARVSSLRSTVLTHEFCAASPAELQGLLAAIAAEWEGSNRATDGTFVGCIPYLQLVATVR